MSEREPLAKLILGMSPSVREKWFTEHLSREESYPWPPRSILPERRKPKGFICVEIMGLPESGKTSGYQHLLERLPESFSEIVGVPEFGGDEERVNAIKSLQDELARNALLDELKLASLFQKGLTRITDLLLEDVSQQRQPGSKILVCERSPNDVVALFNWICTYLEAREELPELRKDILRSFLEGLAHAEMLVDAVVLYGVSLETAKQRRRERGLPPEGKVTNELVWPKVESSYSWWLGSIYPLLRERSGIGLLVIDGEGNKEENNLTLLDYVKEAGQLTF